MGKKLVVILISSVFLMSLSSSSSAANLTGAEIEEVLSGNTTDWVSLKKDPTKPKWSPPFGRTFYSTDGKYEGVWHGPSGHLAKSGEWSVENNQLCIERVNKKCFDLRSDGGDGYYMINRQKGKKAVHIKKILKGRKL